MEFDNNRSQAPAPAPLTRRQARELENAGRGAVQPAREVAQPARELVRAPARADVDFPRRSSVNSARKPGKAVKVKRTIKRGKASSRPAKRRPSSVSSKLLSLTAMLFAGALLVGMSVPANAFITADSMVADAAPLAAGQAEKLPGQSLAVSADAASNAPLRDSFDVISYAQVLQLKYAGISYAYTATSGAVRWPFPYPVPITDGFGERVGGFHKGVDFVPGGGTPIYAIADGIATVATEDYSGYGQHVVLTHDLAGVKVQSLYAHMITGSSPIALGQEVKVGDFLGLVGDTGVAYGAHLHFEILVDGVPVDPFAWLQANAVN